MLMNVKLAQMIVHLMPYAQMFLGGLYVDVEKDMLEMESPVKVHIWFLGITVLGNIF